VYGILCLELCTVRGTTASTQTAKKVAPYCEQNMTNKPYTNEVYYLFITMILSTRHHCKIF